MTKHTQIKQTLTLTAVAVDETSQAVAQVLEESGVAHRTCLKICLGLEEILLRWMQSGAENRKYIYLVEHRFGKLGIFIRLKGPHLDPLDEDFYGEQALGRSLLASLGQGWEYHYTGGVNQVALTVPKPLGLGPARTMALCMLGAVLVGLALQQAPEAVSGFLLTGLITPLFDTFLRFMSATVGPLMFLSVAWGICSLGDPAALGRMGKRLFGRWFFHLGVTLLLSMALCTAFFPPSPTAAGAAQSQMGQVFFMLLDIVPGNFFTPFTEGNTLQILFLAVVVGSVVLMLKHRAPVVAQLLEQCDAVMRQLLSVLGRLIPGFVFLSVLRMMLTEVGGGLADVSRFAVAFFGSAALTVGVCLTSVLVVERISPWLVMRKLMPSVMLSFATASSAAAFPLMQEACEKQLGIERRLVDFALPMGVVVFKPAVIIEYLTLILFCAKTYGIPMTAADLIMVALMVLLLSIATPPVPGGALTCFTLLFTQLGIPLEALVIAGTLNMLIDFPLTAVNTLAVQIQLLHGAKKLGMIDEQALRNAPRPKSP